ncbi:hypothetical protein E2986_13053 [Frieseomelitta varia]|uniref:Uncharacterized protein n=1 Tax=Frieseomelitta varia TaxID=561572 RepID=A0A833RP09_9HYME|nr:hypothetical protein E2986_13053 [Frieseomelitta varia]
MPCPGVFHFRSPFVVRGHVQRELRTRARKSKLRPKSDVSRETEGNAPWLQVTNDRKAAGQSAAERLLLPVSS